MSQRTVLDGFHRLVGLHVWLMGILVFIATLALIGCLSPKAAGARQVSGAAKPTASNGEPLKRIGVPAAGMRYIDPTFSGDSRRFIAINEHAVKENVRVWDVSTLQPLCDPLPDTGPDFGLTFDGKIAFTTDDKSIRFWNVDTSKLIRATKVSQGELHHVHISPDGTQFLAIVRGEQAVEVWRTGEARPRFLIKQDAVDAAFDPTGTRIAILTGSFHIFSAETGKEVCPPISSSSHHLPDLSESFDSTGRWFLMQDWDAFKVVDTSTGKTRFHVVMEESLTNSDETEFVRWSSDYSKIVATLNYPPQPARIYDAATGKLERTLGTNVSNCWVGPGSHWAMGFRGALQESFDVWDVKSGRRVQTLNLRNGLVSPDCSTILTMREDGLDPIWRMQQN